MQCILDGAGEKSAKKRGTEPRNCGKYSLTNQRGDDKMVVHTVVVCPFVAILPNMVILSQDMGGVNTKVIQI